jgi:archaellum biogenesis ATPase FlaH
MTEKKSKNLVEYDGEDRVVSSQELYLKLKEQPESIINAKSFIPTLDNAIDGFREGELIVISGPTKNGKTLLAQSFTVAFEKQQYYPLWFSFEVPTRQFLNQFHVLPLIYLPTKLKAHALPWVEDRVYESFEKYHTRIIFCDHLHYLVDLARVRNPSIEIGQIIRKLKSLAVSGNFLIFLLCHTTKGSSENNLSFESIRDSSFISQESDSVLMIKRTPDKGENRARLRVEFHRRTGVIEKVIELVKIKGYLAEYTEGDSYERGEKEEQRSDRARAYVD